MTRTEILGIITTTFKQLAPPEATQEIAVDEHTPLFGRGSVLDSMTVVSLIIETEQQVNDKCNTEIIIADDRAMAQQRSPFRTLGSLAEYVETLVEERVG